MTNPFSSLQTQLQDRGGKIKRGTLVSYPVGPWSLDLLGRRYGKLTIKEFLGVRGKSNHITWMCLCDCGNTRIVRATKLVCGNVFSCAKCAKREGNIIGADKRRRPIQSILLNTIKYNYMSTAKKKGHHFSLSSNEVHQMITSKCWYCGVPPSTIFTTKSHRDRILYNGMDRVDNTKGYFKKNTVPCCSVCNFAKRDMALEQFLQWVYRVSRHQRKKKNGKKSNS